VTEDGIPIAYSALEKGVPVVSASGREFGKVEHVLEIPAEDLFDCRHRSARPETWSRRGSTLTA